jgi:hypothetical protein
MALFTKTETLVGQKLFASTMCENFMTCMNLQPRGFCFISGVFNNAVSG